MAYKTIYNDVIFIEGEEPNAKIVGNVSYKYGSFGSQLKNLNDVKKFLALEAKIKGCNCVVNFQYGQKSSWLSLDDMKWYGKGKCAIIDPDVYDKIVKEIQSR